MITNFEKITEDLTDQEKELLPRFVAAIKTKVGKKNIITATQIQRIYADKGMKVPGARIRKIINYIRTNELVPLLVSTSNGYFIATKRSEVESCIKSLKERESAINAVRQSLVQQLSKSSL